MRKNMQATARMVRPRIVKLARQGKAVDTAFKAVRLALFPDATPGEIANLRTMFFAGAAEVFALQLYGLTEDATQLHGAVIRFLEGTV